MNGRDAADDERPVTWLNWRPAEPWEADAIRHGRQCALDRDEEQLAGLIATAQDRPRNPSAASWLTDIATDML